MQRLLLVFIAALTITQAHLGAQAASGKCLHCQGLGVELQRRLDGEKPRNHLDLRHRLDSQGNRYGKVIAYKVSELRVVELLDKLCDSLATYDLVYLLANETAPCGEHCSAGWNWVKARGAGAISLKSRFEVGKAEMKSRQRDLENYCSRVMEEWEDELSEAIQQGKLGETGAFTYLCEEKLKICKPKVEGEGGEGAEGGAQEAAGDGSGTKEEL